LAFTIGSALFGLDQTVLTNFGVKCKYEDGQTEQAVITSNT